MQIPIDQIRSLYSNIENQLRSVESQIQAIENLPPDATTEQMLRLMLDVSRQNLLKARQDLQSKLDELRPILAGIIIAAPAPGGRQ